jgi:ubiquinone/menaquinone biosynthesis C-methylase UbiE
VDYDKTEMPSAYDAGRGYTPALLACWLNVISRWIPKGTVSEILDLGCGTGRYSGALAAHFDAHVIAVDPSEKMLAEARKKPSERVRYECASGESLPLPDASVDVVFISMVFHHFEDPGRAVRECHRVLRAGGSLCLRAGTTDRIQTYPYVPFFARSRALLSGVLQSQSHIESTFDEGEFQLIGHELVRSEVATSWEDYAEKVAHRADSILAQLSDQEFEEGLAALSEYAATAPRTSPVVELVDFFVFRSI